MDTAKEPRSGARARRASPPAEAAIPAESEDLYRLAVEHSSDPITLIDTNGGIVLASPGWRSIGYEPEEVTARTWFDLVHPDDVPTARSALTETVETGRSVSVLRLPRKDGSWVEMEAVATLIPEREGRPTLIPITARDVTARRRAERRVAVRTAVTRLLAESPSVPVATRRILQTVCTGLGWEIGAMWRVDPGARVIRCVDVWHRSAVPEGTFVKQTRSAVFERGVGLPGRVWETGDAAWIEDVLVDRNFPRAGAAEEDDVHSAFGFPILLGSRVLGVIEFFTRDIRTPDDELLQTMGVIGSQIGQFLQRREAEAELAYQKALLESQSEAALDGILVVAADGRILSFNRRFVEMWRMPGAVVTSRSDEEALRSAEAQVVDPEAFRRRVEYLYQHPDELGRDEIELKDGRVFDRYSAPVKGADGAHRGRVWFFRDITDVKRHERDLWFLADATELLTSLLDPDAALDEIARLSVPHLADWCTTYLTGPSGSIVRTTTRHVDPAVEEELRRSAESFAFNPDAEMGVPKVLRTGEPELYTDADAAVLSGDVDDPAGQEAILAPLGITSWMCVPLRTRGMTIGAISFISTTSGRRYRQGELALAQELARRAALAIDNARLHEREVRARAAAERAVERTARLQAVTAALSGALTPAQVAEVIVREGIPALAADALAVFLLNDDGDEFSLLASAGYSEELGERWASFPAGMPGPAHEALRTGEIVVVESPQELVARWPNLAEAQAASSDQASLTAPLRADGRTVGVLHVVFRTARTFDQEDRSFASTLAGQCVQALERSRLYERQHRIAETLQRSLLPERLPERPDMALAGRYEPGSPGTEVGGDWYDAMALPDGTLGLVVGDVCGHGMEAAAAMSQFRNALRAYAFEGLSPGEVLQRLNGMVNEASDEVLFATMIYVVLDPGTGTLRLANAGHPPPLVRATDGTTTFLDEGRSIPVGAYDEWEPAEATFRLDPGSTLLLYTDGLVEDRTLPIGEGLDRLQEAVTGGPAGLDQLLDDVLRRLLGAEGRPDDVAVLGVQREPAMAPLRRMLPGDVSSLAGLRASLRSWLAEAGVESAEAFEITVACNEAVANAIEHSYASDRRVGFEVELADGEVVVRVRDRGRWRPGPADPERGRGLQLMRSFMRSVEIRRGADGTEILMRRPVGWKARRDPAPMPAGAG